MEDLTPDQIADELVSYEDASEYLVWSLRQYCGAHDKQWEFARSQAQLRRLCCARQSGKSSICDGILLDNARRRPLTLNPLFGLNGVAVRENNWIPIWQRMLEKYHVARHDQHVIMRTTFPNESRVLFTGSDDERHIKNALGNRLDGSVIIIDECQDQPEAVLEYLIVVALPPMMTPTTRLVLAGVFPDHPVGRFYELRTDQAWEQWGWARADNPHTPEAAIQMMALLRSFGLTEEDLKLDADSVAKMSPGKRTVLLRVMRDWLAYDVYDPNARDYYFREDVNLYDPVTPAWANGLTTPDGFGGVIFAEPHAGITNFAVALDPGGDDPFGCCVLGWGPSTNEIQQLVDWASPRGARLSWGNVMESLGKHIAAHYPTLDWVYDTNSDTELDTFGHDYKVPVIKAAAKSDFKGQLRRTNDLLVPGRLKMIRGGQGALDMTKASLDKKKMLSGTWEWSAAYHPTVSECCRYCLGRYWPTQPKPKTILAPQDPFDTMLQTMTKQAGKNGPRLFSGHHGR